MEYNTCHDDNLSNEHLKNIGAEVLVLKKEVDALKKRLKTLETNCTSKTAPSSRLIKVKVDKLLSFIRKHRTLGKIPFLQLTIKLGGKRMRLVPIPLGLSPHKKFYSTDKHGNTYFLKIYSDTDIHNRYNLVKDLYQQLTHVSNVIPMPAFLEFGYSKKGIYSLYELNLDESLAKVLKKVTVQEQYELGATVGEFLKTLHEQSSPPTMPSDWASTFSNHVTDSIQKYLKRIKSFDGSKEIVQFVENNMELIQFGGEISLIHGDLHPNNILVSPSANVSFIDFDALKFSNPYLEFRNLFSPFNTPAFLTGLIYTYTRSVTNYDFWRVIYFFNCYHFIFRGKKAGKVTSKVIQNLITIWDTPPGTPPTWYCPELYKTVNES